MPSIDIKKRTPEEKIDYLISEFALLKVKVAELEASIDGMLEEFKKWEALYPFTLHHLRNKDLELIKAIAKEFQDTKIDFNTMKSVMKDHIESHKFIDDRTGKDADIEEFKKINEVCNEQLKKLDSNEAELAKEEYIGRVKIEGWDEIDKETADGNRMVPHGLMAEADELESSNAVEGSSPLLTIKEQSIYYKCTLPKSESCISKEGDKCTDEELCTWKSEKATPADNRDYAKTIKIMKEQEFKKLRLNGKPAAESDEFVSYGVPGYNDVDDFEIKIPKKYSVAIETWKDYWMSLYLNKRKEEKQQLLDEVIKDLKEVLEYAQDENNDVRYNLVGLIEKYGGGTGTVEGYGFKSQRVEMDKK